MDTFLLWLGHVALAFLGSVSVFAVIYLIHLLITL